MSTRAENAGGAGSSSSQPQTESDSSDPMTRARC